MKYLSVCSGIEAATVAWHHLGWEPVGFSEIEAFPAAVLNHHYPDVPNLGDMTNFKHWNIDESAISLLVGGTPCQSFSVAGLRKGLSDDRGNLSLTFCEMADHFAPDFVLWENVPGVLSSKDNAFGCFLGGLAGEDEPLIAPGGKWTHAGFVLGPKRAVAWRILDAQYFGVAQRRRRLFVVASPRDGADPRKILFESEGLRRDTPPSREKGQRVAPAVSTGAPFSCTGNERVEADAMVPCEGFTASSFGQYQQGVGTVRAQGGALGGGSETLVVPHGSWWDGSQVAATITTRSANQCMPDKDNFQAVMQPIWRAGDQANSEQYTDLAGTLNCNQGQRGGLLFEPTQPLPFDTTQVTSPHNYSNPKEGDPCHPLASGAHVPAVAMRESGQGYCMQDVIAGTLRAEGENRPSRPSNVVTQPPMQVRRLTPVECERLQGFPDGHTAIPWRNKPAEDCPDGPRYKALGNSMAVPVMRWIGERIDNAKSHVGEI